MARARWGAAPRVLRLNQLSPEKRSIILALLDLGEPSADAKKAAALTNATAQEETRASAPTTRA